MISNNELSQVLPYVAALKDIPEPAPLKRLINALRADNPNDEQAVNAKLDEAIALIRAHPEYGTGLATFVLKLISQYRQITLYTDTGIASDQNFFQSMSKLIGHRFLPLLPEDNSVVELSAYLFDHRNDDDWLATLNQDKLLEFLSLINIDENCLELVANAKNSILNALVILSYRISGIGLHPEFMNAYPQILSYSAAFVAQNQETVLFVNEYRRLHELDTLTDIKPDQDVNPAPLLVMLEQCEEILNTIKKRVYKTGISIRMTNMLVRLEQNITRMHTLIGILTAPQDKKYVAIAKLIQTIVRTSKTRYSFGYLIENNTKLLSRKVTENAGKVGEHYISTDKAGYQKMYKKAAIGGLLIACMATMKTLAYEFALAPIGRAFVNSMIYGLGFVMIHAVRGTVATKQPAMTAAAIASTISDGSGKKKELQKLSELIVDILRTQFIAIIGNISIAMPVALLIGIVWTHYHGTPMIDSKMAAHLLHDLDPFRSLAIPHAAIAGVFLFLSGLIAGYYDNLSAYNKVGERLRRHWLLLKLLPKTWLNKVSTFVENNLGAIMGNFIFGCFLGSTATIGYMLGLPIDIRHIAFASANFAQGLYFLSPNDLTWQVAVVSFLGVLLIGLTNLAVSFSLALYVALRSKEVSEFEGKKIASLVFAHLKTHPLDFILPRRQSVKYAQLNSDGQVIFDDKEVGEKSLPDSYVVRRLGKKNKDNTSKDHKPAADVATTESTNKSSGDTEAIKSSLPKPDKPPQLPK